MNLLKRIEDEVGKWNLPYFIENTILGLLAFFLATLIHESGHTLTALILGCNAGIAHVGLITGATGVASCAPWKLSIIALAGPLTAFMFGLLIWFTENENSRLRLLSIILFFLSSSLQLVPTKPLDGYWAIYYGCPRIVEFFIFLTVFSVSVNLLIDEIKT